MQHTACKKGKSNTYLRNGIMDWVMITGTLAGNSMQVSNMSAIKRTKCISSSRNTKSQLEERTEDT